MRTKNAIYYNKFVGLGRNFLQPVLQIFHVVVLVAHHVGTNGTAH